MEITRDTLNTLKETTSHLEKQFRTLANFFTRRWRSITPHITDPTVDYGPQHFMEQTAQVFNIATTRYSILHSALNSLASEPYRLSDASIMPPEIRNFLNNAQGFLDFWNTEKLPLSGSIKSARDVENLLAYLQRPEAPEFLELARAAPSRGQTWEDLQVPGMETVRDQVEQALISCAGGLSIDIHNHPLDTVCLLSDHRDFCMQLKKMVDTLRACFPEGRVER